MRLVQTLRALVYRRRPSEIPTVFPNEQVRRLFRTLSAHDQRHLIMVYEHCLAAGLARETCLAGLLHDIGKASLAGRSIPVLARISQVIWATPTGQGADSWITPRSLAAHHARSGAVRLRALAVDERVCWLVEDHDDGTPGDIELDQLRVIDNSTP
jgi:hypothetical protein